MDIVERIGDFGADYPSQLYLVLTKDGWRAYNSPGVALHAAQQIGPEASAWHVYLGKHNVTRITPENVKKNKELARKWGYL